MRFLTLLWFDCMCKMSKKDPILSSVMISEFRACSDKGFFLSFLKWLFSPHLNLNICSHFFYLYIVILISHILNFFFWPVIEFQAIKRKCRNALYFMTSFLHWKILNIFREKPCKIVNMSRNIIKFYRYEKNLSEFFFEILIKGEIVVRFFKKLFDFILEHNWRLREVHTTCTIK